jgi:hypothetical protein
MIDELEKNIFDSELNNSKIINKISLFNYEKSI